MPRPGQHRPTICKHFVIIILSSFLNTTEPELYFVFSEWGGWDELECHELFADSRSVSEQFQCKFKKDKQQQTIIVAGIAFWYQAWYFFYLSITSVFCDLQKNYVVAELKREPNSSSGVSIHHSVGSISLGRDICVPEQDTHMCITIIASLHPGVNGYLWGLRWFLWLI